MDGQKICPKCTLLKDFSEFHKDKNRKDGLNSYCKLCGNVAYLKSRHKKLEHYQAIRNARAAKNRAAANKYKADRGCMRCNENDHVCLDFHHSDPTVKEGNIGDSLHKWSWKRLLTEIEKCIILCSNCHRKFHAGRFTIDI